MDEGREGRGIWRICPTCGERFYILYPDLWVYKKDVSPKAREHELVYFNKYTCKKKYDDEYEIAIHKRKSEALKKMHKERRERKLAKIMEGET